MSQPTDENGRTPKVVNDPIHGLVTMPGTCVALIDTPEFQRLRSLKQLGAAHFVFPGATHTRFEHSLGVSHLAGTLVERFRTSQPELGIDERDALKVRLAGLCHDIGHGPFSHGFEAIVERLHPTLGWTHEDMSLRLIDHMVDKYGMEAEMDAALVRDVKDLINGKPSGEQGLEKRFLFDIVANSRNGIDVDKLDYLQRDCYNVGIKSSFDANRLMSFAKVLDNEVVFYYKEAFSVYQLFATRYTLHKTVYQHRVVKAIEFMITDAMLEANSYLKLAESVQDPAAFCRLNDGLLGAIEYSTDESTGGDEGMRRARDIVQDIRHRRLYSFVDEIILSPEEAERIANVTEATVANHQATDGGPQLHPDDLILCRVKMNYGNRNVQDTVRFWSRWESSAKRRIDKQKVSLLIPDNFAEVAVRLYLRGSDVRLERAAKRAFDRWTDDFALKSPIRQERHGSQAHSPPERQPFDLSPSSSPVPLPPSSPVPPAAVPDSPVGDVVNDSLADDGLDEDEDARRGSKRARSPDLFE